MGNFIFYFFLLSFGILIGIFFFNTLQVRRYRKAHSIILSLNFFTTHSWTFISNNPQKILNAMSENDKSTFDFDVRQIDWPSYVKNYICGIRKFILKVDLSSLPAAKANLNRYIYHYYLFFSL